MIDSFVLYNIFPLQQTVVKIAVLWWLLPLISRLAAACFHTSEWINQDNKDELITVLTFPH